MDRKFSLTIGVVVLYALYILQGHMNSSGVAGQSSALAPLSSSASPTPSSDNSGSSGVGDMPTPTSNPTSSQSSSHGSLKDGQYTGSEANAFYGLVEVKATVSGGKLTDIAFPEYPSDRGHTLEVSQMALPQLRSEAIQAQSSQVDVVSGATDTSQAFMQSLADALQQAGGQ